jgi:tRNA modification GTPase
VKILCLDSTRPTIAWEAAQLAPATDSGKRFVVWTKVDAARRIGAAPDAIATSSVTGEGIEALRAELRSAVFAIDASGTGAVAGTAIRCRESLRLAAESLQRARRIAGDRSGEELVAAEVRLALEELGKVVGAVYTEDVLDRIFSRFCIGK